MPMMACIFLSLSRLSQSPQIFGIDGDDSSCEILFFLGWGRCAHITHATCVVISFHPKKYLIVLMP